MDAEAKADWQVSSVVRKSNAHYFYGDRLLKHEESKNMKNSKAKKNYFLIAHSISENSSWSNQALGWSYKKHFYLNRKG